MMTRDNSYERKLLVVLRDDSLVILDTAGIGGITKTIECGSLELQGWLHQRKLSHMKEAHIISLT